MMQNNLEKSVMKPAVMPSNVHFLTGATHQPQKFIGKNPIGGLGMFKKPLAGGMKPMTAK